MHLDGLNGEVPFFSKVDLFVSKNGNNLYTIQVHLGKLLHIYGKIRHRGLIALIYFSNNHWENEYVSFFFNNTDYLQ